MALQEDTIYELTRSRKIVGELLPICIAKGGGHDGEILNGRHRNEAGWRARVEVEVADDLDFHLKRLHFLVQRGTAQAEHASALGAVCEDLERKGMEPGKIAKEVVEKLSPFQKSYTYELIPDRFKRSEGYKEKPIPPAGIEVGVENRPPAFIDNTSPYRVASCAWCGQPNKIVGSALEKA